MNYLYQRKWMNRCLMLLLLATIAYPFTRLRYHEWISYLFIILTIWHHYLNKHWWRNLWRCHPSWSGYWTLCVNVAYVFATIVVIISGLLFSSLIPHPNRMVLTYAKYAHIVSASWFIVLTGCHLGIHANRWYRTWQLLTPKVKPMIAASACALSFYGIYCAHHYLFFPKMVALYLRHAKHIHLADLPLFLVDHLSIVFAFAFFSAILHHYLRTLR